MTTIAVDKNGLVAYDSRAVCGSTIVEDDCNKKIVRDDVIYFFAGREADEELLIDAVENGAQEEYDKGVEVVALIVSKGNLYSAGITRHEGFVFQKERIGNPVAIGSGQHHALTAMDLGCDAKKAVKMAAKRDVNTGGRIRTYQIK